MKRNVWFIIGGILLVALLAGAAYLGGQWVTRRAGPAPIGGVVPGADASRAGKKMGLDFPLNPAPELPKEPETFEGRFVRRADRSIFANSRAEDGVPAQVVQVEIVINQDTKFYRDTTRTPDNAQPGSTIQETVVAGSLDEIGQGSDLRAWGPRSGDRITATTIWYSEPRIMNAKPGK